MSNNKIPLWFHVFIIFYVISFTSKINLEFIKYVMILLVQIISLLKIKNNKITLSKKSILLLLCINCSMMLSFINTSYIGQSVIKTLSIIDMLITATILLPAILKKYDKKILINAIRNDILIVLSIFFIIYNNDFITGADIERNGKAIRYLFGFNHPNTLAIFAYIDIIMSIYLLDKNNTKKTVNIIIIAFLAYIIYLSDSRTAMYCIPIFIILTLYDKVIKKIKNKKLFFLSLGIIGVGLLLIVQSKVSISLEDINYIMSNRLYYYSQALNKLVNDNMLFTGVGAYTNSATWATNNTLIDNGYINYIYQFGIISFIFLMIFLIYNYKIIKNSKNMDIKTKNFIRNAYICFIIYSFIENILINISSLYAIIIFLLIYILKQEENNENNCDNSNI